MYTVPYNQSQSFFRVICMCVINTKYLLHSTVKTTKPILLFFDFMDLIVYAAANTAVKVFMLVKEFRSDRSTFLNRPSAQKSFPKSLEDCFNI